jgi:septal ring factor EnvC (AmiA/AmiB activator)
MVVTSTTPDLLTYGLTSAAAAGPVGVLLLCAVIWFAKRDAKREDREREDRVKLTMALAASTAALIEQRKESETLRSNLKEYRADHKEIMDALRAIDRKVG